MPIETATYIADLNASNPASTDEVQEGDNHLRLLKSVLKASFPNIDEAMTASDEELNYSVGVTSAIQTQLDAKAPLASPGLTGTPTVPTAAVDTSTTQAASTAFVTNQAASATPAMDGTGAVGTSKRYARGDHVHPTDTSRAPLASPTFTGTPAAPTAAKGTATTQLATTAFVDDAVKAEAESAQVATSYTLQLTDQGKFVTLDNASAIVLNVPPNSSVAFPVGSRIDVVQAGAGQVTITPGSGVTVRVSGSRYKTAQQYSGATLWKQASDIWYLFGDLSA